MVRLPYAVGLALMLAVPAATAFGNPYSDAELLALETSGELFPPSARVDSIDVHLQAIRAANFILEEVQGSFEAG